MLFCVVYIEYVFVCCVAVVCCILNMLLCVEDGSCILNGIVCGLATVC